jgi:MinD superfamily P-loop ATPase
LLELVILSGKGGTGKTSLTASFAHLADNPIVCDLDVDAPDLHLLLHPKISKTEDFYAGHEARVVPEKCTGCELCVDMCQFKAVFMENSMARIDPIRCEGCKVCVAFCPQAAIDFQPKHSGRWYLSDTRFGRMAHAQLFPAEENSGKLVALLRQKAKALAVQHQRTLIISDGPPGIGCPVISSLTGSAYAIIVTEPTPSGRHDLARIADLCRHFNVPAGIIINKSDLNADLTRLIESDCTGRGLTVLGRIPHDPAVTRAMIQGQTITEFQTNGVAARVRRIWENIEEIVGQDLEAYR